MKREYDVVIAGGGMVGSTLACALGGGSLRVAVVEPQAAATAHEDYDLRVSAITPASQTVFDNLGAWDGMHRQRVAPVETMRVWERERVLHYDSAEIGEPCLAWIVENRVIVAALAARLATFSNIEVMRPARVETIEIGEQRVTVGLDNGRALATRLLVGADGAESRVRQAAAIGWKRHDLGQAAIVAMIHIDKPHGRCAYQNFLASGPLAFLPLAEPNTVSIVWSADNARATELLALDDDAFNIALQAAFGDELGTVRVASPRAMLPLALGFAEHYTRHRIALIGDAAHTVHPLAGQGVNLGILDAATLAATLNDAATRRRDPGTHPLLRRYERARKGADVGMQLVTGGFRYLFGSGFAPLRVLRGMGLVATEGLPPLKHFFMRRASGLSGERPVLARRIQR